MLLQRDDDLSMPALPIATLQRGLIEEDFS
jgi:hypothetical protein